MRIPQTFKGPVTSWVCVTLPVIELPTYSELILNDGENRREYSREVYTVIIM